VLVHDPPDASRYLPDGWRLFPLRSARQAMLALEQIQEHGYALMDAGPSNVLLLSGDRVAFGDFEFLLRYGASDPPFDRCYNGLSPSRLREYDKFEDLAASYDTHWQPYVGLDLVSLKLDPPWLQRRKRAVFWLREYLPERVRQRGHRLKHKARPMVFQVLRRLDGRLRHALFRVGGHR
jgi:hypothetical protein